MMLKYSYNSNHNRMNRNKGSGFTMIEVLIVMGILAILMAVTIVALNPGRQFAQARNTQRIGAVGAIVSAIGQNMADNMGVFTCAAGTLPATDTPMKSGPGGYDIRPCLVPAYLPDMPIDPSTGSSTSPTEYASGYSLQADSSSKRVTVNAPGAELGQVIRAVR